MPYCNSCKQQLSENFFKKAENMVSKVCVRCLNQRNDRYANAKNQKIVVESGIVSEICTNIPPPVEVMFYCNCCKKQLPKHSFKQIKNKLTKTCVHCLSQRRNKYHDAKIRNGKNQQESSPSDTATAESTITEMNINTTKFVEIHIDDLSQFVEDLLDSDNCEEFDIDIVFEIQENFETITEVAQKIREEVGNGNGYKWK